MDHTIERVRRSHPEDRTRLEAFLAQHNAARVARLGQLLSPLDYPMLVAEADGRLAGVLTYVLNSQQCEILTLHAAEPRRGTGTALVAEVERLARSHGCERLFVITTNDNLDALRFYQRRGFRLVALRPGAVDDSRAHLKPEIPAVGSYGIALRDEIELEKRLVESAATAHGGYGHDLAGVHHRFFGDLARRAGAFVLHELRHVHPSGGLVVYLGCGSGILARRLTDAGYDVLGVDSSPDMIRLASAHAPRASFVQASLLDVELPSCIAVTAIGESLNYTFDSRSSLAEYEALFRRIHQALEDRGIFIFDVAGPGRVGRGRTKRTWHDHADWSMHVEAAEDEGGRTLTRDITLFQRVGQLYRRSEERHRLQLYPRQAVAEELRRAGFRVRPLAGYGQVPFGRGWAGFLARKSG